MYQKTTLIGRVGQKKLGNTKSQKPVIQYSLATTEAYKDKQTNDWIEKTEWHQLVSFNQIAEHVDSKIEPGDVILVEGKLSTQKWEDKAGVAHYTTQLIVNGFPKKMPRYYKQEQVTTGNNQQAPSHNTSNGKTNDNQNVLNHGPSFEDFDDDIPF